MSRIDEYLEKKGFRHLMAFVTVLYIVGTIIFNIYLRSLGIFEFELIQLRYVFVGLVFAFFTVLIAVIIWGTALLLQKVFPPKKKKLTKKAKAKRTLLIEISFICLLIPWVPTYAFFIFPQIPSGFGGSKPIVARLIGAKETIKNINALIAHETGTNAKKLPYESVSDDADLAIGANVKILDRNRDRILLILTKELYLSSTSKLAKDLIEAGTTSEEISTTETKNFQQKTLLVKADRIESISFSLYTPPEILTTQDLEIATKVLTDKKPKEEADAPQIVEKFITQQAPQAAPKILAAVKKEVSSKKQVAKKQIAREEPKESGKERAENENNEENEEGKEESRQEEEIEIVPAEEIDIAEILETIIDTMFIEFRAKFFRKASDLHDREKFSEKNFLHERFLLAKKISKTLQLEYPEAWSKLIKDNYLAFGQGEKRFPWKLMGIFRGTESAEELVEKLNTTQLDQEEIEKKKKIKAKLEKEEQEQLKIKEEEQKDTPTEPETPTPAQEEPAPTEPKTPTPAQEESV